MRVTSSYIVGDSIYYLLANHTEIRWYSNEQTSMLLAAEGGRFFSSSASGYSKGLTLLLLGQKNEEKPIRVSPWNNQYHLVDQGSHLDPDLQLVSKKNRLARGCWLFICFGCTAARLDSSPPLKVGPTQQQDIPSGPHFSDRGKDLTHTDKSTDESDFGEFAINSNLKKHIRLVLESAKVVNEDEVLCEKGCSVSDNMGRRSVQWTDASGAEFFKIREFEPSEGGGSDDDFDDGNKWT